MRLLSIDTSTHIGSVALRDETGILGLITLSVSLTHSEGLMPAIDALLQQTQTAPADLTAVACVTGPGSYTGLRIGIATAQGLAAAHGLQCVGIPSLEVYAHAFPHAKYPLCPLLPARKGWVYARIYGWEVDRPVPRSEELNLQPDELIKEIQEPTLFYGPGLGEVKEELKSILREEFIDALP
ncbi:tRNA (adenosine(37)-N6)-threonylcarbamoyltransferase complex dimerization subunit type 1 TsaB, partial [bacterium]|nr:tRNA (adenosine(37)-N6)-threonylcarbamoyltransferase complex dimerization subunit type 1 TsaB [bacterium]